MQTVPHKHLSCSSASLPQTGIDTLLKDHSKIESLKRKKVGLLANQSSLTADFIQSAYALHSLLGQNLTCLFAPEHGWSAFCAAGEEIKNEHESHTNLPIFSLFASLFEKNLKALQNIDVLIIDIQDVGVRCYTYAATCAKILEYLSLEKYPLKLIICDRPNPLGGCVKGPFFDPRYKSLISYIDVPFQHGKTIGALLEAHNLSLPNPVPLSIVGSPSTFSPHNVWIPPSPGLPDWDSVLLYPGLVLLEGVNVSEGRGSSLPFKCVAAPELDSLRLVNLINKIPESGIKTRPFSFVPQNGKFRSKLCEGAQIHIVDYQKVDGLRIGLFILHILTQIYPLLKWEEPLFEEEDLEEKYLIDELTGNSNLREAISRKENLQDILESWNLDYKV